MGKRYLSLWFRHLLADWQAVRRPELKEVPFVFTIADHGRKVVMAANMTAEQSGVTPGMTATDARAIVTGLEVFDHKPGREGNLLGHFAKYCLRYAPIVAVDLPDGLLLDVSGCAHLYGGERGYYKEVILRLRSKGYDVRGSIADTIGAAWAVARYGEKSPIVEPGEQRTALLTLHPAALRLEAVNLRLLHKMGFYTIRQFIDIERSALRRRFDKNLLLRLDQALGAAIEPLQPIKEPVPYEERLPCLEPVRTRHAIEIAIQSLLEMLCARLKSEGLGIRKATLYSYRIDGEILDTTIGTSAASHEIKHLFGLFALKIDTIRPKLGIELFILNAEKVEPVTVSQETLWAPKPGVNNAAIARLLDRIAGKVGAQSIKRYLPAEHHLPTRSYTVAVSIKDKPTTTWQIDRPRPVRLLKYPIAIQVSAPIPDYPPMLFIYQGKRHAIKKADGPERIEPEWWDADGEHYDYYLVETVEGKRFWLYRLGHYDPERSGQWFLHGFFA